MCGLGARYGLDVDRASVAAATVRVLAPSQCSAVEACLEFLTVLLLPLLDCNAVLLLNPVTVPFGYDVEGAEGYDSHVWGEVVYVATL